MTAAAPTRIGIAVVEHQGRYLVGTRADDGPLPGLAEFPGGKLEPGETSKVCAVRECREETGLAVQAVELLMKRCFTYHHGTVDLDFWLCRPVHPEDLSADCQGFRWVSAGDLTNFPFPEANQPLIHKLVTGE